MTFIRNVLLITFFVLLYFLDRLAGGLHEMAGSYLTHFVNESEGCSATYCAPAERLSTLLVLFIVGVLAYVIVESQRRWFWTAVAATEFMAIYYGLVVWRSGWVSIDVFGDDSASLLFGGAVLFGGFVAATIRAMLLRTAPSLKAL
jgi:hypothetical protein